MLHEGQIELSIVSLVGTQLWDLEILARIKSSPGAEASFFVVCLPPVVF